MRASLKWKQLTSGYRPRLKNARAQAHYLIIIMVHAPVSRSFWENDSLVGWDRGAQREKGAKKCEQV